MSSLTEINETSPCDYSYHDTQGAYVNVVNVVNTQGNFKLNAHVEPRNLTVLKRT